MKNNELLNEFNKELKNLKSDFHFLAWEELTSLSNESLKSLFDTFTNILTRDGVDVSGDINQHGKVLDDICSKLSQELVRRSK